MTAKLAAILAAVLALPLWAGCAPPAPESDAMRPRSIEEQAAAFTELGKARLLQGDLAGALSELAKADTMRPNNVDTLTLLGLTYYSRKDYQEAIDFFNRALAVEPGRSEVHNNLGLVYLDTKDYVRARQEFETALADPTYARSYLALFNLGLVSEFEGQAADAEAIYKRVMLISPQYSAPLLRLARMQYAKGEYRAAADLLSNAVRLSPNSAEAYWMLAETYEKMGLADESAEAYGKVINLSPNTAMALEAQSRVRKVLGFE